MHDLGNGNLTEAIAHSYYNIDTGQSEVHVLDIGSCTVGGTGDCLSSEDSSIEVIIGDARFSSFETQSNTSRLHFSSASTNELYGIDLTSLTEAFLRSAHEVDSAD